MSFEVDGASFALSYSPYSAPPICVECLHPSDDLVGQIRQGGETERARLHGHNDWYTRSLAYAMTAFSLFEFGSGSPFQLHFRGLGAPPSGLSGLAEFYLSAKRDSYVSQEIDLVPYVSTYGTPRELKKRAKQAARETIRVRGWSFIERYEDSSPSWQVIDTDGNLWQYGTSTSAGQGFLAFYSAAVRTVPADPIQLTYIVDLSKRPVLG